MQFTEDQIVNWTRFLLDNGIQIKQVDGGLWKATPTGHSSTIKGVDLTRAFSSYREAVLTLAPAVASNASAAA